MDQTRTFGDTLAKLNRQTIELLEKGRQVTGLSGNRFDEWLRTCHDIDVQMAEDLIRVAVVGSIKSGKSTFANAILGGDYLKRGAGVVTSMVTRVHRGKSPAAKIYLKSWDEINTEIAQALVLLPHMELPEKEPFDLRKQNHRNLLQGALDQLGSQLWTAEGTADINGMLLRSYLNGYDEVADQIGAESATLEFGEDQISHHRDYTGHDRRAVYLQDILLHIKTEGLLSHVELADCQGSDSPNPLHLAMIQEYLRLTHLIFYVISSRTGLRRADIRFLSMIKKMGLISNLVFIINCDLSEHESLDGLQAVINKTQQELAPLDPSPEIYSISALFKLFQNPDIELSVKDQQRMGQWEQEREFVALVENQWERFLRVFNQKVTQQRYALFTRSHLTRLKVILSGLAHWIEINGDLLSRDVSDVHAIREEINGHRTKIENLQNIVKSTLDGEVVKVKQKLSQSVAGFFDDRNGQVFGSLLNYVRQYQPPYDHYQDQLTSSGLTPTLYTLFQDFRRSVDTYMTETVNPEILSFVRNQETLIQTHFQGVAGPYDTLAADAVSDYNQAIQGMNLTPVHSEPDKFGFNRNNIEGIKRMANLAPPPAQNTMRYSAIIRSDAVLRLGFYAAVKFFKRLLKKNTTQGEDRMHALKDGVKGIKRETEKSLRAHFMDYRENLKFQYLNKLAESASGYVLESLTDRLNLYATDLSGLESLLQGRDSNRREIIAQLKGLHGERDGIFEAVQGAEKEIVAIPTRP